MNVRVKKLIGLPLLLLFLPAYVMAVVSIAPDEMSGFYRMFEVLFYLISGVLWVIPVGVLIKWMQASQ